MLRKFFKFILYTILSFIVFVLLMVVFAAATMGPTVKKDSLLVLDLKGPLMEVGPQDWKQRLFMGDILTTRSVISALRKAKTDNRIKGLLVTAYMSEVGIARAQEIRHAIQDFTEFDRRRIGVVLTDGRRSQEACANNHCSCKISHVFVVHLSLIVSSSDCRFTRRTGPEWIRYQMSAPIDPASTHY